MILWEETWSCAPSIVRALAAALVQRTADEGLLRVPGNKQKVNIHLRESHELILKRMCPLHHSKSESTLMILIFYSLELLDIILKILSFLSDRSALPVDRATVVLRPVCRRGCVGSCQQPRSRSCVQAVIACATTATSHSGADEAVLSHIR